MKKIFAFIVPIILCIALCLYLFNYDKEYNFLTQIDIISKQDFVNPLDIFNEIGNYFDNYPNLLEIGFGNAVLEVLKTFVVVCSVPIVFVIGILKNIYYAFKSVLILLGLNA